MEPLHNRSLPEDRNLLQVRTVFSDRDLLTKIGRELTASGQVSGFVVRDVALAHGPGFELVICVPLDQMARAQRLAEACTAEIRRHWHTPATFIEPPTSISEVVVNPEFQRYVNPPERSPLSPRSFWTGIGMGAAAGLAAIALCGKDSARPDRELAHARDTPFVGIASRDGGTLLAIVPDPAGMIVNSPHFVMAPSDMAAIDIVIEAGASSDIIRAYRDTLEGVGGTLLKGR